MIPYELTLLIPTLSSNYSPHPAAAARISGVKIFNSKPRF
jgi:hypothetical protein